MKLHLCNIADWKAVHFADRTIIKADLAHMSGEQRVNLLYRVEVKPDIAPGHYRAV